MSVKIIILITPIIIVILLLYFIKGIKLPKVNHLDIQTRRSRHAPGSKRITEMIIWWLVDCNRAAVSILHFEIYRTSGLALIRLLGDPLDLFLPFYNNVLRSNERLSIWSFHGDAIVPICGSWTVVVQETVPIRKWFYYKCLETLKL